MIEAKDLRIGNILQYFKTQEGKWDYTTIDWQDIKWCDQAQGSFNEVHRPTDLTAEVLWQCGFKFDQVTHYKGFLMLAEGDGGFDCWYKLFASCPIEVKVKYLHQLQNLFYSLTGEELNFLPL